MTPTEQDKELHEAVSELGYMCPADSSDVRHLMQLILADRKKYELQARFDEVKRLNTCTDATIRTRLVKRQAELKQELDEL